MRPSRLEMEAKARNAAIASFAIIGDLDAVYKCMQGMTLMMMHWHQVVQVGAARSRLGCLKAGQKNL